MSLGLLGHYASCLMEAVHNITSSGMTYTCSSETSLLPFEPDHEQWGWMLLDILHPTSITVNHFDLSKNTIILTIIGPDSSFKDILTVHSNSLKLLRSRTSASGSLDSNDLHTLEMEYFNAGDHPEIKITTFDSDGNIIYFQSAELMSQGDLHEKRQQKWY